MKKNTNERRRAVRQVQALRMTNSVGQIQEGLNKLGHKNIARTTIMSDLKAITKENMLLLSSVGKTAVLSEMFDRLSDLREAYKILHSRIVDGIDQAGKPLSGHALAIMCNAQDSKSSEIRECEAMIEVYRELLEHTQEYQQAAMTAPTTSTDAQLR